MIFRPDDLAKVLHGDSTMPVGPVHSHPFALPEAGFSDGLCPHDLEDRMSTRIEGDLLLENDGLILAGDLYGSHAYVVTYDGPDSDTRRREVSRRTLMPGARVYVNDRLVHEEGGTFPTIGSGS